MPPKKPPHPLEGKHIFATGADPPGYLIGKNGLVNPKDAAGNLIKVFSARRTETIDEATARLEEHIRANGELSVPHNVRATRARLT